MNINGNAGRVKIHLIVEEGKPHAFGLYVNERLIMQNTSGIPLPDIFMALGVDVHFITFNFRDMRNIPVLPDYVGHIPLDRILLESEPDPDLPTGGL